MVWPGEPQNMTFSERNSGADKSSDIYNFAINFYLTSLE